MCALDLSTRQAPAGTAQYSRHSPSPRYRELLAQYTHMHVAGDVQRQLPAEHTYNGCSLPVHAQAIKELIDEQRARSILDYGAGKGFQYTRVSVTAPDGRQYASIPEFWGIETLCLYDPGYEPFRQLPAGQFDGVVCTDVLEHCPEDDLEWILHELFAFARRFVYANVACYPATKHLPSGENAHCTIQPPGWWAALVRRIAPAYPRVRYLFTFDTFAAQSDGTQKLVVSRLSG